MRLDKWLKNSRIIKRRTVAKEAAEGEKIVVNGKLAKPSTDVKVGDKVEVHFGEKVISVEVLELLEKPSKEASKTMFQVL